METSQIVLIVVGVVLFGGGIALFVFGWLSKGKLLAMKETPTISVSEAIQTADPSGTRKVEISGIAESTQPLGSPIKQIPCVYYHHVVEQQRTEYYTNSDGFRERRETWEKVHDEKNYVPFTVRDASGMIEVIPEGAEFIAREVVSGSYDRQVGGATLGETVGEVLGAALGADSYGPTRQSESVIPTGETLYILGNAVSSGGGVSVQKSEGPFIISYKSEEELTKRYKLRYGLFLAGGFLAGLGGIAAIIYAVAAM